MSFKVGADAYDRFMGRYSVPLAPLFADFAAVADGQRVVDVGCGPGALTAELVGRLGSAAVSGVDPSESFVAAMKERYPAVAVQRAAAEQLPFTDEEFDAALAQLVVHFMADPVAGLREMGRVTRSGGVVAACVWDHEGGKGPLSAFWQAAREFEPDVDNESGLAGPAAAISRICSTTLGCARSRRARSRSVSSTRASRNGGSRTRSASAPQATTWPASTLPVKPSSAIDAAICCQRRRSC